MFDHTDAEIIAELDVRVQIQPSTMSEEQAQAGEREIIVEVFSNRHNLYDQHFVAQLDWKIEGEGDSETRINDVLGQLEDDLANNGEIDEETLIRALAFECSAGRDGEFDDARDHLENVISTHTINVARVTVEALLAPDKV